MQNAYQTNDRELVFTRMFDAPRELVWKAWTDASQISQWWGPYGFTIETVEADIRAGGLWRFIMHAEGGLEYPNLIEYTEIVEPERIEYIYGTGEENDTSQFKVTITFEDVDGKTNLTMRSLFPTVEALAEVKKFGAEEGAYQTLDKLAKHLGVT